MHFWGDGFPYFEEVDRAADYIGKFCRKWGRIQVIQTKEKYGTVRVYCSLYCDDIHGLLFPGYHYYRLPWVISTFPILRWARFLTDPYQKWVYRLAYKNAIHKWPMIREEILQGADWSEYLKGL